MLIIIHGPFPLPWQKNKSIHSSDLSQLYVKKIYHDSNFKSYFLYGIDKNTKHIKLLTFTDSPEGVLYLEQQIEKFLGIKDAQVYGEYD